jgi:hypothetical protein
MPSYFEKQYGKDSFEMVQVKDMESKGCFENAVKGVFQATTFSLIAMSRSFVQLNIRLTAWQAAAE